MPIFRVNSIIVMSTLLSISSIHCMKRESLYPIMHHNQTESQSRTTEQAQLLMQDFMGKDAVTFHTTPPSYQELYISEEKSAAECKRLTELLAQKEREFDALPKLHSQALVILARSREIDSVNSNLLISGAATFFYFVSAYLNIGFNSPSQTEETKIKVVLGVGNDICSILVSAGFAGNQADRLKNLNRYPGN